MELMQYVYDFYTHPCAFYPFLCSMMRATFAYGIKNKNMKRNVKQKAVEVYVEIENGVIDTYKSIETGVVNGYKAVENAVVGTYKKVEDSAVDFGKSLIEEYDKLRHK